MNEFPLNAEYDAAWTALVRELGESHTHQRDHIGAFYPWLGSAFGRTRSLLVIGRATNGWEAHEGHEYAEPSLGPRLVRESQDEPLERWVERAWARTDATPLRRSAFWRVARRVARGLVGDSPEAFGWAHHVAWSNLAKLAPAASGNPGPELAEFQWRSAVGLIEMELAQLKPQLALFLTGRDGWFSWRSASGACLEDKLGLSLHPHVADTWRGRWGATIVVVAPHPRSKREDLIANAAVNALSG